MKKWSMAAAAASLLLCTAGCGSQAATDDGARDAVMSDAEAVKRLETAFLDDWEAKRPSVKAHYADDATIMLPNAQPITGPEPIARTFERFVADPNASFDATNSVTVISEGSDLAYSQGTYRMRSTDRSTGKVGESQGYYLLVHKKQPDGTWKVVQDVSSPLP